MTDCRAADDAFGPAVSPACRTFDFTLLFEEAILSLLPNALLLVLATLQTALLSRKPTVVRASWSLHARMVRVYLSAVSFALLISPGAAPGALWAHSGLPYRERRNTRIQIPNFHRFHRRRVCNDRLGRRSPLLHGLFQNRSPCLAVGVLLLHHDHLYRRPHSHLVAPWR